MPNREIVITHMLYDPACREALQRALCQHPDAYGFHVSLEMDPEDATWHVWPIAAHEKEFCARYGSMFIARNPAEVDALRHQLGADPTRWQGLFAAPLPDFSQVRIPWHTLTPEYVAAIDRLKSWAEAPICLGDLDPAAVIPRLPDMPRYGLVPLAERMLGRIFDLGLSLGEMVDSTLIYSTRIPEGQERGFEWCVRATIHIERAEDIWITNLELVGRAVAFNFFPDTNHAVPGSVLAERAKWEIHLPEITRQLAMLRILKALNVVHDEDPPLLMSMLRDQIDHETARAAAQPQ